MGRLSNTKITSREIANNHEFDGGFDMSSMINSKNRIVYLSNDVNEHTISRVVAELIALANHNANAPIQLIVSTYGGSVDEMFCLYDTMKFLPCPVITIGMGKIMSAGILLLAAGAKGKRLIGKNARLMMHPASGGAQGNVFEVLNEATEHKRTQDQMVKALSAEMNVPIAQIEKIMRSGHDYYFMPEEALKLGIVDKIIG